MYRLIGAMCVALFLAACGGGESTQSTAGDTPAASTTAAASAITIPQPLHEALKAAIPPSRAAVAGAPLSVAEAFAWAEANYPDYFPLQDKADGFLSPYTFRYYPRSDTYLGVATASDDVAVFMYGALNGWSMTRLGALADFTCVIKPSSCVVGAAPSSLLASVYEGGVQQFVIEAGVPLANGTLAVSTGPGTPWLSASLSGTSTVNVTASATALPAGSYVGTVILQFTPAKGVATPRTVPVSLTVGPGLVAPAAQAITVDASSTSASLSGSVSIARADGTAKAWTASSSNAWLHVTASGTTPSSLVYSVDAAGLASIQNFSEQTATVTVSSAGMSPVSFPVVVSKRLPYFDAVMPYGIPAGSKARFAVHGAGFSQFTSAPTISGVTASNVKVESDTLLTFDATPSSAGGYTLRIANNASIPTEAATLQATVSSPWQAGSTAITGIGTTYIEDPVRKAIFAVGYSDNALYKYQYTGSGWKQSALPLSTPYSLGLSPDGSRLFVMLASSVKEVNPDTLQVVATYTSDIAFDTNYGDPLPASVDGRIWMPSGMRYFDLKTSTFKTLSVANASDNLEVDGFVGAANGSTVLFLPCFCVSPPYPMHQYFTKDGTVTGPMGSLPLWYWTQINSDGSRVMQQWSGELYDASYNLLGQLPDAATGEYWGLSALSPDGTRIATLAYTGSYTASFQRIDVFDTTKLAAGTTRFAKVGSIPITTPAVECGYYDSACRPQGSLFIARDGKTVFWIGNKYLQAYKLP